MASTAHFQNLGTGLQGAVIDAHDPIAINTLSRQEETEQEKVDEKKYGYTSENVDAADSDIMSLKQTEAIAFEMNGDPFPVDPDAPVEGNQLTIRACVVGTLLGFIVGASNVYLGLKTGFTFGATLFAAIVGYGILKTWSVFAPLRFGGGYFGPKENVTVQSAAGAAGGLSGLFVAAVPAMYQLELLRTPQLDISRLIALSFITAFYGLFFAMPLRKYYVLRQKLTFPSPTATAFTIRSLHSAVTPEARRAAGKKIKILVYSFIFSVVWTVVTKYIPGVLWGWDLGWFFSSWGWHGAIALSNWGWSIQFTPAFTAVGFLTGPNAAFSWLGGAILAYAIIGPILVAKGAAYSPFVDEALGYRNNFSMSSINVKDKVTGVVTTIASRGSARYWLLWPGVLIMLVASFTELFLQAPLFYRLGRQLVNETRKIIGEKRGKDMSHIQEAIPEGSPDPAPPAEQVNTLTWVIGATVSVILTIVLGKTEFGLNPGLTILSLILGFVFAFIGVNASGTTDVNPIGVIAKAGQLIIGGVTKGTAVPLKDAQLTNLIAGSIVGQSAAHSVDMVGDLKTGHLIGASPSAQFWAQLVGSIAGFAFAPALYLLFTKAYPCIYVAELQGQNCPFAAPSVAAWKAVTIAVTAPKLPITPSSGYTAIGLGVLAGVVHTLRHFFPQHRNKLPNMNAVGLAFVVPQVYYAIAMVIGSTIAMLWEWRRPRSWEVWGFALAAGLIAGEGIGGVITAILTIAGVDGGKYGSAVGCIMNEYCG